MEKWREVFRNGFAPVLPTTALTALAEALRTDDVRLVQGSTTVPPPLMVVQDWECEAGCALGYCGAVVSGGFGVATVEQAEIKFAEWCYEADQLLGEPAACRHFLQFFDDTPRPDMLRDLLPEVERALAEREKAAA